ncbi:hypothetical protein ECFRIK2001_1649, partial [Escherichia coli FRIK2001]
CRR